MITERFQVPGVSCQHCVNAITSEVTAIPGVQQVQVALDSKVGHSRACRAGQRRSDRRRDRRGRLR